MRRAAIAAMLLLTAASRVPAAAIDTVAVVVNGQPITATEVVRESAFVAATGLTPVDPQVTGAQEEVLGQMILALLLRQRGETLGMRIEPAEVDAAVGRVAANNRLSAAQLEERLRDDHGTWERFRERIADRLLQPRLVEREVLSGIIVTEDEIAAEYDARRESLLSPEQVRISHLLYPLAAEAGEESRIAAEAKAAEARGKLVAGAPFADLVAAVTADGGSGGDLGWFGRGELAPALEEAAFHLPAGSVAGPVRTSSGIHLLLVTERREEKVVPLAEEREAIAGDLRRRKTEAALARYLEKLKAEAIIRHPK